ncbi:MAG: phosphoribosyl-AMP cyclohydrolase [Nitrospiraceae bacterium]|jgi:phosphoribosyl-AMP cyclohydrolase|nr:phosphoribosyl-AMP cyclohydrolase [Nitrospiraceae bacterium]
MIPTLKYDEKGLIPAIVQDAENGEVLMLAYMNEASFGMTLESGYTHFWSRSRQEFWKKGATSGDVQEVKDIYYDCDADTLLIKVKQHGKGACHTGERTCFYRKVEK